MQQPDALPPPVVVRLTARIENLPDFIGPVLALATAAHLDEERKNDLELVLEEVLVNISNYAYPDQPGQVELTCRIEGDRLTILIEDEGVPFSLVDAATPDLSPDIAERQIGGLGVHLIKNLMDEVRYRREEGRNLLELVLYLPPQGARQ